MSTTQNRQAGASAFNAQAADEATHPEATMGDIISDAGIRSVSCWERVCRVRVRHCASGAVLLAVVILAACRASQEQRSGAVEPFPASARPTTEQPFAAPNSTLVGTSAASAVAASRATPFTRLDLDTCLQIARKESEPSEALCPGFISRGLVEMVATCADAGGHLAAAQPSSLWSLDVNGDAREEFLYEATNNYRCDGAASLFSCGSLGCPISLFERRANAWVAIGAMRARDAPAAEVLPPASGDPYGILRGGCGGDRPCEEWTYYFWNGSAYQDEMIEVRGTWVDVANDGLWTLVTDVGVLAAPSPDSAVLERYPKGTEVVVIGNAREGQYKYVSPCNACPNGFIAPAALRKTY